VSEARPTAYEWRQGIDKRLDRIDTSIEKLRDEIKSDFRLQDGRFDKSEERINRLELLVGRINMIYVGAGVLIGVLVNIAIEKLF
jgi:SMC interacting uncharacterized protein involved in chromosome segregation